ncbi:MAG: hypothetical protein KJ621_02000 [Proteobacteria bacterium]|nr:hypothetical protein [Pseudomonadota bacterium]
MGDDIQQIIGLWGLSPDVLADKSPLILEPADVGLAGPPPDYHQNSPARIPLCDGFKLGGDVDMARAREIIRHLISVGKLPAHRAPEFDDKDFMTIILAWKPERVVLILNVLFGDVIKMERVAVMQAMK